MATKKRKPPKKAISAKGIAALQKTARIASELCCALDNEAEDIGGQRPGHVILAELGPATDESDKYI